MVVTIYTDASFKDKSGSWAVHIHSDRGKIRASGKIKKVETNNIAEFIAIKQAIQMAKLYWGDLISEFIVKTDSLMCCHMLWKHIKGGSRNKEMKQIKNEILELVEDTELTIEHTRKDENKLNTWCDREAKTTLNN